VSAFGLAGLKKRYIIYAGNQGLFENKTSANALSLLFSFDQLLNLMLENEPFRQKHLNDCR
jgi:hypothetical protein